MPGFRAKTLHVQRQAVRLRWGVKDGKDAGLLPEELPGDITDYYFSTMHGMPMAQDYRAYAYLIFHGSVSFFAASRESSHE